MNRKAYDNERLSNITKTIQRSDGSTKIYGHNTSGELLTVVMRKDIAGQWQIVEIAVKGRITGYFPV